MLVARDADRLAATAASLAAAHGRAVTPLPADLATEAGCAAVAGRLAADPPVDLLVNNAGIGLAGSLLRNDVADECRMLRLNVEAVLRLTLAALPPMVARGSGAVVNVASVAGFGPMPGTAYPAGKAWVINFSESAHLQVRAHGVRVMALCPGFVRTEFHARAGLGTTGVPDRMWLAADDVVAAGLADLARGRVVSVPDRRYRLVTSVMRHAPRSLLYRWVSAVGSRRPKRDT
ncbi:dehydrogenase [Pilimelia terevasa]|uniref:Dehydrogenase n=1 Tax=Pilimelia terevasa TaxID=53372 RepID=A0A8J3BSH9_9ACTN|nr:dehydrogenase [Pilimelia terevasa]